MINKSKNILYKKGITYREISNIFDITENQAINFLKNENKIIKRYMLLCKLLNIKMEDIFEIEEKEYKEFIEKIKKLAK
jgi:DNA-binding Xre family transcriptional regulator